MSNTVTILSQNYLGSIKGTILEPTSVQNLYRIQGTAKFVGEAYAEKIEVEVMDTTEAVQEATQEAQTEFEPSDLILTFAGTNQETLSENDEQALATITSHLRATKIKVGDAYRYYTRATNRWDLAHFEVTGTDIGRLMSGFAIKSPSGKKAKRKLLSALNIFYGLLLSEDEINESVTN